MGDYQYDKSGISFIVGVESGLRSVDGVLLIGLAEIIYRFVRFPDEPHGLSRGGRTDRRIERLKSISGWFDKYLKKQKKK